MTVTVADALPEPSLLVPVTPKVVVTAGVAVHVAAVVPAQLPPVQLNEVALGLQLAVSLDVRPGAIRPGTAVRAQLGAPLALPVPVKTRL